jgi:hypothetical protein
MVHAVAWAQQLQLIRQRQQTRNTSAFTPLRLVDVEVFL